MTPAVLLDHVSAYAAAVRAHLGDLSPEQVDDLTDGLEADLAEALEDPRGPVATGEALLGRPASGTTATAAASVIDLTRRFGPAAEYAAELRAAAGLAPRRVMAVPRRRPLRDGATGAARHLRARFDRAVEPLRASPAWDPLVWLAATLRPLWWAVRGWVWYVVAVGLLNGVLGALPDNRWVPRSDGAWLLFVALVLLSISTGRGIGTSRVGARRTFAVLNVVAVLATPWATTSFHREVEVRLQAGGYPVYIDNPVSMAAPPEDGVRVDGQLVSNLFVYDAEGNPLSDVQIFDDRGRPVRTTYDEGMADWALPGVQEPWAFAPVTDVDGRVRWNVYPLAGAPVSRWVYGEESGRQLEEGSTPRTPPRPFAKAPAVDGTEAGDVQGSVPDLTGAPGEEPTAP